MNQQRLKAYLNLIQGLLNCPSGEEWILLRQHEDLVNPELVQVMEQVATQLAAEGNSKAAKFLHNWAGQLHHILTQTVRPPASEDKSQAYLELIQALLNCPKGSETEILTANQELIGPGLVQAIKQVASQALSQGDRETASFLSNLAADLNRAWLEAHEFKPTLAKEEAEAKFSPQAQQKPEEPYREPAPTPEPVPPSPQLDTATNQLITEQLAAIAQSLAKLNEILASRSTSMEPLWYLEKLERACTSNWLLTTEEVEQLIGTKPESHKDENIYQRGCWIFTKAGKIGSQTAWRVMKAKADIG
jgi:hypothetical protein